jgi:hypothetical protein
MIKNGSPKSRASVPLRARFVKSSRKYIFYTMK